MAKWYLVLAAVCAVYCARAQGYIIDPADADLTVPELIAKYGYPVETHHVTTYDGYILELHRIPYGRDGANSDKVREVALIMHGLFSSSADFIITGIDHALGYKLADRGYDVWLVNCRGNVYSRAHTSLSPNNQSTFWDFSFDNHGIGDIRAVIDYALSVTGLDSLHYLGHSQGTTSLFPLLTLYPEYNAKISTAQLLAPVTLLDNLGSPALSIISAFRDAVGLLTDLLHVHEIFPLGTFKVDDDGKVKCNTDLQLLPLCEILRPFFEDQVNADQQANKGVLLAHTPAGGSIMQLEHYMQILSDEEFRRFDHGFLLNQFYYGFGTTEPPTYDLSKVTVSVVSLFYSLADQLAVKLDVLETADSLTSISPTLYEFQNLTHFDFAWSDAEDLHSAIIESMQSVTS